VPARTADAVSRLERAGYAVLGKTNLHEFAYGITSENEHFGDVQNPLDRSRYPGGSSGGSAAAVAAGLCDVALGTDSAGSIRIPAACCGIVGFKPTHGLVPMEGCFPLAPSFDTAGPMARTVSECAAMIRALAPGDGMPPYESLEEIRLGVAWLEDADPGIRARVEAAAALFPDRRQIDFPRQPDEVGAVFMREAADVHRDLFREHADLYGANVSAKLERCFRVSDGDVRRGQEARRTYKDRAREAIKEVDLLLVPTMGTVAPRRSVPEPDLRPSILRFTYPFNTLGWPAAAIPCGPAENGLPASVTLASTWDLDHELLSAGLVLESALAR